jgi:hypothetical protein
MRLGAHWVQTSSVGIDGKSWKSSNGAGSSLRECAKLIESGIANSRLALRRMAPPTSVLPSPKEVVDPSQRIPPSAGDAHRVAIDAGHYRA